MTSTIEIKPTERGVVRVFAVDLEGEDLKAFTRRNGNWGVQEALGADTLNPDHVEVFQGDSQWIHLLVTNIAMMAAALGDEGENPEFAPTMQSANGFRPPSAAALADSFPHIEILETLGNPFGFLGRRALDQMGLCP